MPRAAFSPIICLILWPFCRQSRASSAKETYTLSNGLYKVFFPNRARRGFLNRPIEGRGLEPDVPVRCKADDLAAGKDTVLEAAREYLLTLTSRQPLHTRKSDG